MSALTLSITSDSAGGWSGTWHLDGQRLGEPVPVAADQARVLTDFAHDFERACGREAGDGHAVRPIFPASALSAAGQGLFAVWCKPVWELLSQRLNGRNHQLLVQSTLPAALNLPWETLPLGGAGLEIGCDPEWSLYRTARERLADGIDAPAPGPLRILFLAAAPEDQKPLDYEKEEEALLRATAELRGAVVHIAEMGSFDELHDLVRQVRPHIVHLSGHGKVTDDGQGTLAFEDEEGRTDARYICNRARRSRSSAAKARSKESCSFQFEKSGGM